MLVCVDIMFGLHAWARARALARVSFVVAAPVVQRYQPMAQVFARRGCPTSLRAAIWALALCGGGGAAVDEARLSALVAAATGRGGVEYVTDPLYRLDVAETCNDDDYFPFEEMLTVWSARGRRAE